MDLGSHEVPGLPTEVGDRQVVSGRDSYYAFQVEIDRTAFFRQQQIALGASDDAGRVRVGIYAPTYRLLLSPAELWLSALINEIVNSRLDRPGWLASAAFEVFTNVFDLHAYITPSARDQSIGHHIVAITGMGAKELPLVDSWATDPQIAPSAPKSVALDYLVRHGVSFGSFRSADAVGPASRGPADLPPLELHEGRLDALRWLAGEIMRLTPAPFIELNRDPCTGEGFYARVLIDTAIESDYSRPRWVKHLQCVKVALVGTSSVPVIVGWATGTIDGDAVTVEDFYIWPTYRERGSSNSLAFHLTLACGLFGGRTLRFLAHRADVVTRGQGTIKYRVPGWLRDLPWRPSPLPGVSYMSEIDASELPARLVKTP